MEKFVRDGHQGVRFFVGPEVEKTPAADKRTLFVVGLQDTTLVERLAREYKTPHIFLSANRSFDSVEEVKPGIYMVGETMVSDWETQIHYLLDKGFMVSLDYPAHKHALVLKALNPGIWQSRNFVPILSVAIPNVSTSSVNLTIKIDDSNFRATNDGVWCMNHHEVTDSNRFTSWNEYRDDMILTEEQIGPVTESAPAVKVVTPVYADVNKPKVNLAAAKAQMQDTMSAFEGSLTAIQNDASIGLDAESASKLKPDPDEVVAPVVVNTVEDAAAAYADGTKEDPLGPKGTAKPAKVKK